MSDMMVTVFREALFARLMPIFNEVTIEAMAKLNPDAYGLHAAVASLGALIAYAILYAIGTRMRHLPERVSSDEQRARINAMEAPARFWLPYILILAPTPIGTVLLLAGGFFGLRWWLVALVVIAAEVLWRAQYTV